MKKPMLAVVASVGAVLSALSQGSFLLDNSGILPGLAADRSGNWYDGTFGMEVWELNTTTIPAGINLGPGPGGGVLGYEAMVAAGFVKQGTFAGRTTAYPGAFVFGEVDMPHVVPGGATVVLALAAWNTGDASWSAMLAHATQDTRAGVVAFLQPTSDYSRIGAPPPPADLTMDRDLVMTAIPEPAGAVLAGLGGALLLLSRRRGGLAEPGRGGLQEPAPWRRPLALGGQDLGRCRQWLLLSCLVRPRENLDQHPGVEH